MGVERNFKIRLLANFCDHLVQFAVDAQQGYDSSVLLQGRGLAARMRARKDIP